MELKGWQAWVTLVGGILGIIVIIATAINWWTDHVRDTTQDETELEAKVEFMYTRVEPLPKNFPEAFGKLQADVKKLQEQDEVDQAWKDEIDEIQSLAKEGLKRAEENDAVLGSRLEMLAQELCEAQRNLNEVHLLAYRAYCPDGNFNQAEGICTLSDGKPVPFNVFYDSSQLQCH